MLGQRRKRWTTLCQHWSMYRVCVVVTKQDKKSTNVGLMSGHRLRRWPRMNQHWVSVLSVLGNLMASTGSAENKNDACSLIHCGWESRNVSHLAYSMLPCQPQRLIIPAFTAENLFFTVAGRPIAVDVKMWAVDCYILFTLENHPFLQLHEIDLDGGPRVVVSTAAFHDRVRR